MTTPFWCLVAATLLPFVLSTLGGYFRKQELGSIDNKNPRRQAAALEGVGARVYAAHQNSWEALSVFAASVFVAHLAGADPHQAAIASIVFIVSRVVYAAVYIANLDALRSIIFLIGLGSCIWLFILAAQA